MSAMATLSSPQFGPTGMTDLVEIWRLAVYRYESITGTKFEELAKAKTLGDVLEEIQEKETIFGIRRHDHSKIDRLRTLVGRSLQPIERLSEIFGQTTSSAFPPSMAIFTAARFLISTAKSVSADYDKLTEFFGELGRYLRRLRILETHMPPITELKNTIGEILTSVLVLCGISVKFVRKKRIVKAFKNLVLGEDDELASAYSHFHKLVEHERDILSTATLTGMEQLKNEMGQQRKEVLRHLENPAVTIDQESFLTWLSPIRFEEKQRDIFLRHHQGTGQWLLQCDEFQRWFKDVHSSSLWGFGIPGGGKSVLTSVAVNYVSEATEGTNVAVVCLFCDYKDARTHSEFVLLSSIARQLCSCLGQIPAVAREFRESNAGKKRDPNEDEWIALIKDLILPFRRTYVFVDALDECPERNRDKFIPLLKRLESSILLFLTSRPIDTNVQFSNSVFIEISAKRSDMEKYLEVEINARSRLSRLTSNNPSLKEEIINGIINNAQGMFLLAYFQVEHLSKCHDVRKLRKAISILPSNLEEYYDEAINRIRNEEDSDDVKRAMSFIFCARRPLTVDELCHALAVKDEDSDFLNDEIPSYEILTSASVGLLRVDEKSRVIGLAHHTLQEYLEKRPDILLSEPNTEFAKACLTYLSLGVFASGPCTDGDALEQRLQDYQLLGYASHHWGDHLKDQLPDQVDVALSYLEDDHKLSASVQVLHVTTNKSKDWFNRFPRQFGPLHVAAYLGLEKVLERLLEKQVAVDTPDSYGETALLAAAKQGNYAAVKTLLEKGATVNAQNQNDETALHWAAKKRHKAIVEILLEKRASVTMDDEGWTALNWAIVNGDIDMATILMERCNDLDAGCNYWGKALFLAADEGQEAILQGLLDNGVNVDAKDGSGSTALDYAVGIGHEPTVRVLLKNRADVNLTDTYGNSTLHWAITRKDLTQLLLENGSNVHTQNDSGQTALCWAAQGGVVAVAQLLLENGADINWQDEEGSSALHKASLRGCEPMIRLLLENGADAGLKDTDGWTPLHGACVQNHTKIVQLLLDKVDDGVAILDSITTQTQNPKQKASLKKMAEKKNKGSTVLTGLRLAVQDGQVRRLQVMLEKGAEVNGKDAAGYTALEIAAFHGYEETVRLLLEHGADVNLRGSDNCPPLFYAIQGQNENIVSLLLESGSDVNSRTYGSTLIMLAAEAGDVSIAEILIHAGADLNAQDYTGKTALHLAALCGRTDTAQLLINHGAELDTLDDWRSTALMLAVKNSQHAVSRLLFNHGASLEAGTHDGHTPVYLANITGGLEMIQLLTDSGASSEAGTSDDRILRRSRRTRRKKKKNKRKPPSRSRDASRNRVMV